MVEGPNDGIPIMPFVDDGNAGVSAGDAYHGLARDERFN
jgi:hypothetical protein